MTDEFERYHVYAKLACPACKGAIDFLKGREDKFIVTIMDNDLEKLEQLKAQHNWNTVPIILGFTKEGEEVLLGGFSDIKQRFASE